VRRFWPPAVVDPKSVKPPLPAGRGPGSLAPLKEQLSDEVDTDAPESDDESMVAVAVVVVSLDTEVGDTAGLPAAKVVVSADAVDTPSISVVTRMSPSVTLVSGTPTSGPGSGVGVGAGLPPPPPSTGTMTTLADGVCEMFCFVVWVADCQGRAIAHTTNIKEPNKPLRTFLAVTLSMVLPPK
jgi:hypothetical protein